MPSRGEPISLFGDPPVPATGESQSERRLPLREEVLNGRTTDSGAWEKRAGMTLFRDLGVARPVVAIVPWDGGLAITDDGSVWRLGGQGAIAGSLPGDRRPVVTLHDGAALVSRGSTPMKISADGVTVLGRPGADAPAAPTVASSGHPGGVTAGTYEYVVSQVLPNGETLPSTASSTVTVPVVAADRNQGLQINVSRPVLDDLATAWRIYRRKQYGTETRLVAEVGAEVAVYEDNRSAADLLNQHDGMDSSRLLPPAFTQMATVGDRVVGIGHSATEFRWTETGSSDNWRELNFSNVALDGGRIMAALGLTRDLIILKNNNVEVWTLTGGAGVFARRTTVRRGCIAPYSAILVEDTPYFFGDDRRFYAITGSGPVELSVFLSEDLATLQNPETMYAVHFRQERSIRWFHPPSGRCFGYDYGSQRMFEDKRWDGDRWQMLAIGSGDQVGADMLVGDSRASGKVYRWTRDAADDAGEPIRVLQRFSTALTHSGAQARANKLILRAKRGHGSTTTDFTVRWGFDQGSFVGKESVSLGAAGDTDPVHVISSLGVGREIRIELEYSGAERFLLSQGFIIANRLGH